MLQLAEKYDCCGCGACVQGCPKQCISMKMNPNGFYYPVIDKGLCIDCGLCERVCPLMKSKMENIPSLVFAAQNTERQTLQTSSSGGVFPLLANEVMLKKGVVFGAEWDSDWSVKHSGINQKESLISIQSSKYVQSDVGKSYQLAKEYLDSGRIVLFSGTPCQIAGLKSFINREYNNSPIQVNSATRV